MLIPDKPGELVRVASVIAGQQGNVIKLDHNQFVSTNRNAAVELKITLEAFGTEHKNQIVKALGGCRLQTTPDQTKFINIFSVKKKYLTQVKLLRYDSLR